MKVTRPPSFIPFGPLGHPEARFFFKYEAADVELATALFCGLIRDSEEKPPTPGEYADIRDDLGEKGYFMLPVVDGLVSDKHMATLRTPPKFVPAAIGAPGRRLEHFPHLIPGYYQHYQYEAFTQNNPDCDHDFGHEWIRYVFVVEGTGEVLPLKQVKLETSRGLSRDGKVYLTVTCTRCSDVHALRQDTESGQVELH